VFVTLLFFLPFLVLYTVLVVYAERKISAFMQDRLGPMEVGYYGILQTVADLLKLLQKEDIIPAGANKQLFQLAPLLIFVPIFMGFSMLPITRHPGRLPDYHLHFISFLPSYPLM
jgi:NADH-quinone oxidoreductase subunit H